MKTRLLPFILFSIAILVFTSHIKAQTIPTVEEVTSFFKNQNILLTYRDGEVIYGTYYFIEIHYCRNGYYGLYGSTVKRTVLDNEQKSNWQEFGSWKVTTQNKQTGIFYQTTAGVQNFVPIYRLANGDLFVRDGLTIVKQGTAICQ